MSSRVKDPSSAEIEALQARIAALEQELFEVTARANAAIAAAEDRAYWLDRWHLDLNALMRRRGAREFRAALRAGRTVVRWFKQLAQRLRRR